MNLSDPIDALGEWMLSNLDKVFFSVVTIIIGFFVYKAISKEIRILKEKRQVIPCYGGISNVHINYDGEVWPCCVLGYDQPLGSLRDNKYDFQKIWNSAQADLVRKYIYNRNCACPLANQAYSNILCSPVYLIKAFK